MIYTIFITILLIISIYMRHKLKVCKESSYYEGYIDGFTDRKEEEDNEDLYQEGYRKGSQEGFQKGYCKGIKFKREAVIIN